MFEYKYLYCLPLCVSCHSSPVIQQVSECIHSSRSHCIEQHVPSPLIKTIHDVTRPSVVQQVPQHVRAVNEGRGHQNCHVFVVYKRDVSAG